MGQMRVSGIRLAQVAVAVALAAALAACGGSSSPAGSSSTQTAQSGVSPAASPSGTAGATTASSTQFTPIVEPFDPGHPARNSPAPASCGGQQTTLAITQCFEDRTENTDAAIDTVGSDEAIDVSVALVADRNRIATIAAFGRGLALGLKVLGGAPGAAPAPRSASRLDWS